MTIRMIGFLLYSAVRRFCLCSIVPANGRSVNQETPRKTEIKFVKLAEKLRFFVGAALGRPQVSRGFPGRPRAAPTGVWIKNRFFRLYAIQMALNIWKQGA
ncbi:MAG: hypothetical protein LUC35_03010 [Clostridiales bacterium]|nr:hypothetical protein [Clostridiales bacterium]